MQWKEKQRTGDFDARTTRARRRRQTRRARARVVSAAAAVFFLAPSVRRTQSQFGGAIDGGRNWKEIIKQGGRTDGRVREILLRNSKGQKPRGSLDSMKAQYKVRRWVLHGLVLFGASAVS